jgi:hypothetical protein
MWGKRANRRVCEAQTRSAPITGFVGEPPEKTCHRRTLAAMAMETGVIEEVRGGS